MDNTIVWERMTGEIARVIWTVFAAFWPLWVVVALLAVGKLFLRLHRDRRLAASGITDIDRMDGRTFERYLRAVFDRKGFDVHLTRYVGDYGADLILRKGATKTVVQAKRSSRPIGVKAIQEAVAAKGLYGCGEAMVITNSHFTRQARILAECNSVRLWSRRELIDELVRANGTRKVATANDNPIRTMPTPSTHATGESGPTCAVCGKQVTQKVWEYCTAHPQRFRGKVYCFQHQRDVA